MGRDPDNIPDVVMEKFDVQMQIYGIVSFARCQFFQIYTTAINSLKPSDANMHQQTNRHWFR